MKDIGTTATTLDPVRDAFTRVVRRIQWDADLAYLISPGTETYDLLLRAVQHVHGFDEERARDVLRCRERVRSRLVTLRERVEHLEALLDERCDGWRDSADADVLGGGAR